METIALLNLNFGSEELKLLLYSRFQPFTGDDIKQSSEIISELLVF